MIYKILVGLSEETDSLEGSGDYGNSFASVS